MPPVSLDDIFPESRFFELGSEIVPFLGYPTVIQADKHRTDILALTGIGVSPEYLID